MTHKLLNSVDYHKLERGELPAPHIPIGAFRFRGGTSRGGYIYYHNM